MNKTLLTIMLICILSACKKSNESLQKAEELPNVDISLSALNNPINNTEPEGDVTYNFLGYGYDITDKYSSAEAVRMQVVDIHDYVAKSISGYNPVSTSTSGFFKSLFARDAAELSFQLTRDCDEVDGLRLGKPTIVSAFSETDALSNKYAYSFYTNVSVNKSFRIYVADGRNSLSTTFSQDVNGLSPEQLVSKYGTHILQLIYVGSRINIIYQSEVPLNSDRKQMVTQGFNYALKNTFGIGGLNFEDLDVKALNSNLSIKLKYEVIGGDPTKVKLLDFSGKKMVDLNDWNKSITESNNKFLGFSDRKGIVPLYDVIDNSVKKAAVKAYIENYILENQTMLK